MTVSDIGVLVDTFCFPWTTQHEVTSKWTRYFEEHQKHIRTVYLLEKQKQLIGYASLLYTPEYSPFKQAKIPEIHDVLILESFRNQGYGKLLIRYLENIAHGKNYTKIGIGVGLYRDYGPAQALYCKLGYVPDGNGVTYKTAAAIPGTCYPIDDDLVLWLVKAL